MVGELFVHFGLGVPQLDCVAYLALSVGEVLVLLEILDGSFEFGEELSDGLRGHVLDLSYVLGLYFSGVRIVVTGAISHRDYYNNN